MIGTVAILPCLTHNIIMTLPNTSLLQREIAHCSPESGMRFVVSLSSSSVVDLPRETSRSLLYIPIIPLDAIQMFFSRTWGA